ncbi:hypothetical protein [Paenarthrobacter nicotinovorans]|uniref:hypothetical protein n=1 Tax=Paenarthrobacter nicotinovorans TaxID=29320 RepID=UPI0011A09099|nr:hypothetical protein [Paenarthrobacter nicotinovorans]
MTSREDPGRELPTLAEFMSQPTKYRSPLPDVVDALRTADTATAFLHALFLPLPPRTPGKGLDATDTYLRKTGTGFVRGNRIYLYPRQSLHTAKSNARSNDGFLSASAQRVENSLLAAGWRCPNPGMEATVSIVEGRKRRTAWEIPAYVYTHAKAIPTHTPATPAQTLRALCRVFTVRETARLFDVGLSTIEYWIYMSRPVPDRITKLADTMYAITSGFLLAGHSNPLFWLRQPSTALQRARPNLRDIPRELLLAGESAPVLEAAAVAIAAGDSRT